MADLSAPYNNRLRGAGTSSLIGIAAGVEVFPGGLAFVNADGYLVQAIADAARCVGAIGRASEDYDYDNTGGGDGDKSALVFHAGRVRYNKGVMAAASPLPGTSLFAGDDHTLKDAPGTGSIQVGRLLSVEAAHLNAAFDLANIQPSASAGSVAASTQGVEPGSGPTINEIAVTYPIQGKDGPVTLASSDLPDGIAAGQVICLRGADPVKTVTIPAGAKTALSGGVAATLGTYDSLVLEWTGSLWFERGRSMNSTTPI